MAEVATTMTTTTTESPVEVSSPTTSTTTLTQSIPDSPPPTKRVSINAPPTKSSSAPSLYPSKPSLPAQPEEEDHVAAFKRMLDDILDNAASESVETSLSSKVGVGFSSSTFLTASSSAAAAAAAADRARLSRSTTLGFLLPQPKNHFAKLKSVRTESNVDSELLHKLEEQNNNLPPQDSTSFLLARLERQNGLLDTDPKSVCIESNVLKGNLNTLHRLIADSTALNGSNSETVDPMSTSPSKAMVSEAGDEEIDLEFWGMLVQDYNAVASKLPHLLAARVRQGLPSKLRGLIWQSMSQASSTYLETMYSKLLLEHSPYERIIQRDLARTFPQVDMFKEEGGKGQEMLRNILKAYSLYDPHVGYCQGLGFLVGPLLMNMDEKEAFCVFVRLMETYDMRTMFTLNMEGLQLRLYQFSALLSEHLPMLHAHLSFHSINAAMYASQWFLSLFAYTYPLPLVLRVYDVVFTEGAPETIMRVAVAFLKKNEEKLMQLQEFEDLLRPSSRLSIAASFGSSASLLLGLGGGSNSSASSTESSEEEEEEVEVVEPVAVTRTTTYGSDAMLLEQIQDLAKALSMLQKDHVEVTEGLVTAKMEKTVHLEEIGKLRKKVADMERQQNRASMMSAISPSVMSDTSMMSSPRTITHEDGKMRSSNSWSRHSEDEMDGDDTKASSVSSLNVGQDDVHSRLAQAERELIAVTAELVNAKVSVLEAMNQVEQQKTKTLTMEHILMDSKEAVVMLQEQQMALQSTKLTMVMEMDAVRHERDSFEKELNLMRQQFEETKKLWLEGQVERHTLQEKVKELEMNAAFAAANPERMNRGRSFRKSINDVSMLSLMNSRSGSPSPLTSAPGTPVTDMTMTLPPHYEDRRGSADSNDSYSNRSAVRRGSSDTLGSTQSGRESTSSARPAAMVRKGWPSEKAASAGVVPSVPVSTAYGTRKFIVAAEGDSAKVKRNPSQRNSFLGGLSFRRSVSDS
ncbi:hypothetical protein BGX29_003712 [Mortierella sp. GBA35]|nr:hypothetical protein BGX29_003712 [Mortierella sp. GBA35]